MGEMHDDQAKRCVLSVDYDEYNPASYRGITAFWGEESGQVHRETFPTVCAVRDFVQANGFRPLFSSSFDNFKADGGELPMAN